LGRSLFNQNFDFSGVTPVTIAFSDGEHLDITNSSVSFFNGSTIQDIYSGGVWHQQNISMNSWGSVENITGNISPVAGIGKYKSSLNLSGSVTYFDSEKQDIIEAGTDGDLVSYTGVRGKPGSRAVDTVPTSGSVNLVTSGGVNTAIQTAIDEIDKFKTFTADAQARTCVHDL
jgi:hypothetical protein